MNSTFRFIALAMCIAVVMSATTGTFSSTVETASASSSAVEYSNGWVVTLTAGGWISGDAITLSPSGTSVTWTTLTANADDAVTGVGIVATTCTTDYAASATSLIGKGNEPCPADIATLYIGTPSNPSSTSSFVPGTTDLPLETPVKWTLTAPETQTSDYTIGIAVSGGATSTASTAAEVVQSVGAPHSDPLASLSYVFYVETKGTNAVVCFQTDAQYTEKAGDCGKSVTSSASIVSVTLSGLVAMIAALFFK